MSWVFRPVGIPPFPAQLPRRVCQPAGGRPAGVRGNKETAATEVVLSRRRLPIGFAPFSLKEPHLVQFTSILSHFSTSVNWAWLANPGQSSRTSWTAIPAIPCDFNLFYPSLTRFLVQVEQRAPARPNVHDGAWLDPRSNPCYPVPAHAGQQGVSRMNRFPAVGSP
jgi:hypothetical protein